jgi:hypothetical protein
MVRYEAFVDAVEGELVSFGMTYSSPLWTEPLYSHSTLRFIGRQELQRQLTQSGFRIERQLGDWDGSPLTLTSPEIITIATSPIA